MNVDPRKQSFLNAVLGERGAEALMKAAERSRSLEHALVPRAILAWVKSASMYEGSLPGLDGALVSFEKSDEGFTGSIGLATGLYKFQDASVFHLAASIAMALGVGHDEEIDEVRDLDLERLGKSIDILAKARRAAEELEKTFCAGCIFKKREHREGCEKAEGAEDLEKGKEGPGRPAAPLAPAAPVAPTSTAPAQPTTLPHPPPSALPPTAKPAKAATAPKSTAVKLTRSEAATPCPACAQKQFGDDSAIFRGCMCFRALAAGVRVLDKGEGDVILELDPRMWDREAVVTFLESVGRE